MFSSFDRIYFFIFVLVFSERRKFNGLALAYNSSSLLIDDNPTLIKNEGETVTLFCKFSSAREAVLREVVWYREMDDGASSKLLTYDAVMNITQVSKGFDQRIEGAGPRFIQIRSISSDDDGWYQCHVGVYVGKKIVEEIGFIYLNVLVPPKHLRFNEHEVIEGNLLFRHNFSLVCTVDQSKPATSLVFTRNGVEIPELTYDNSSVLLKEMAGNYADLLMDKDVAEHVSIDLNKGKLQVPITQNEKNTTSTIIYTTIHLKGKRVGKKLWESTSYLLWVLRPTYDVNAEYGCQASHDSFKKPKLIRKRLRPPKTEWLVIETKPLRPIEGGSVVLKVKGEALQNSFPPPLLLWTNKGSMAPGKRFYVGNRILIRNLRRNNTEYKVQAFNALGSASSTKTIVLQKRHISAPKLSTTNFYENGCKNIYGFPSIHCAWLTSLVLWMLLLK